jgi:hypothetical protein
MIYMKTDLLKVVAVLGIAVLSGCGDTAKTTEAAVDAAKTVSVTPVPVSGKTAYWEMYTKAREWAKDLQPLALESDSVPGMSNGDGKAAMWVATFGSPSLKEARKFTYAVVAHQPDIYKGVTIGNPLPWSGPTRDVQPFQMSQVSVDSDAAFKSATADASAWLKKHPGKDVKLTLRDSARYQIPTWFVFGAMTSRGTARLSTE